MAAINGTYEDQFMRGLAIMHGMDLRFFDSSVIGAALYGGDVDHSLRIWFRSGKVYEYDNVSWDEWDGFQYAESQGKYFNKHIRNQYTYKLVNRAA